MLIAFGQTGQAATYSEEAVKAAFLHRFAAYVQWPSALPPDAAFVIGVYRADPVADQLKLLLPGLSIQDRHAEVRKLSRADELAGVQLLYVGSGSLSSAQDLLAAARSLRILVVTDDEGGLARGAVINFIRMDRTVRIEVSVTAAERNGLKIQSGLLSVAARVEGRPQAELICPNPARVARLDAWRPSHELRCTPRSAIV